MERTVRNLEELKTEAARLAESLKPKGDHATLVTLSGELGAGKTALTALLAKALGITEEVTSPTFVLEKVYALPQGPFKRLIHIDAYRLENGEELTALGFDEAMEQKDTLIVLEWPERVADRLPPATKALTLTVGEDESRILTYA